MQTCPGDVTYKDINSAATAMTALQDYLIHPMWRIRLSYASGRPSRRVWIGGLGMGVKKVFQGITALINSFPPATQSTWAGGRGRHIERFDLSNCSVSQNPEFPNVIFLFKVTSVAMQVVDAIRLSKTDSQITLPPAIKNADADYAFVRYHQLISQYMSGLFEIGLHYITCSGSKLFYRAK